MADVKISQLLPVVTPADTDNFVVEQGGVSKRMTLGQITGSMAADLAAIQTTVGDVEMRAFWAL